MKKSLLGIVLLTLALLLDTSALFAQGDGPRSFMLLPKGVTGVNVRWLGMNQNLNATGTILIPKSEIKINVFPITAFQTFSLGGRFAQVYVMVNPGSVSASAKEVPPVFPLPTTSVTANGLSDGFVEFKMGLMGAPAMDIATFMKAPMRFSLFGDLRYWYSGSYDASKAVNLGTNRPSYQIGLPMAIPLNKNMAKATWLEISPSVFLFGANNEPPRGTLAKKIEQDMLFSLETHISHNFNPKFWVFANLLYRAGGQTTSDGKEDDNAQNMLGGGAGIGYQFLPFLGGYADYGGILAGGPNDAKSTMIRVALSFTYAKLPKKP
ncbi:MAG: transporter [Chitinophagaceae bacterium]